MSNDTQAKTLLKSLTDGLDFTIPNVDFNSDAFKIPDSLIKALQNTPTELTNEVLTEGHREGKGTFDVIMQAMGDHLLYEYKEGRITGAEYTKAYASVMAAGLQCAVQYLLGRDTAYYGAIGAQAQALTQNLNIYKAKVELAIAQAQAHQNKADYANKVLNLANVDQQKDLLSEQTKHTTAQMSLTNNQTSQVAAQTSLVKEQTTQTATQTKVVEKQVDQTVAQTNLVKKQTDQATAQITLIGEQSKNTTAQTAHVEAQTKQIPVQTLQIEAQTDVLKKQLEQLTAQIALTNQQTKQAIAQTALIGEQAEQAHAQVSDTMIDGKTKVTGYTGNQNSLLKQQVIAFKKDSVIKAAKIYADSFATQLSMSTATAAGTGLDANGIGTAMSKLASTMDGN